MDLLGQLSHLVFLSPCHQKDVGNIVFSGDGFIIAFTMVASGKPAVAMKPRSIYNA